MKQPSNIKLIKFFLSDQVPCFKPQCGEEERPEPPSRAHPAHRGPQPLPQLQGGEFQVGYICINLMHPNLTLGATCMCF